MWTLLVMVLLSSQVMGLADNDNYVLYAEDIGGYPVLSSDGYLYLIGSNITKINLIDKAAKEETEIYYDTTESNKVSSFNKGLLNNDESLITVYTSSSSGPNCARVLILTSELSIKEDNCFKITSSNTFGPVIKDIEVVPGIDIYYAVGYHLDYFGSENTAFILKYELQTNYVMNVLSYKTMQADWEISGKDGGFVDVHFDRNGTNLIVSGIMKDTSDKEHILVFSMNRETDNFNWFKYLQQVQSSTISVSSRETKSTVVVNTNSGDAVIV